jgi:membrane protease subunit (stomatin/prohibitin family)
MRAAMVGGAGYVAGKHMAAGRQREDAQDQEISQLEQTQGQPAPQRPQAQAPQQTTPVTSEADRVEALTKLKSLLDDGVLTQEQFDAERQKLLQGM